MAAKTLEQMIAAVKEQRAKWQFPMQPPCPGDEVDRLRQECRERFGAEPPQRYLDLLRITNGFWENGLHVYASRISELEPPSNAAINGFLEATDLYRANFRGFEALLAFAEDDAYVYAMDTRSGLYVKQAYVETTPSRTFDTFDELMAHAIEPTLVDTGKG